MANFCGKCGTKLDEKTGKCAYCASQHKNDGRKVKKKRYFRKILIILFLLCALSFGISRGLVYLGILDEPIINGMLKKKMIERDIAYSLDYICNKSNEGSGYIYGEDWSVEDEHEIMINLKKKISYDVTRIVVDNDKAIAEIEIVAPDMVKILEDEAAENNSDLEIYLENINLKLSDKVPMKKHNINIELVLVDEHWYIVPNSQLVNALYGGLMEQYFQLGMERMEQLQEE